MAHDPRRAIPFEENLNFPVSTRQWGIVSFIHIIFSPPDIFTVSKAWRHSRCLVEEDRRADVLSTEGVGNSPSDLWNVSVWTASPPWSVIIELFTDRRWIRLLYSREFHLPSVLQLWDALFSEGTSLALIDYVFIAMLLQIRDTCE